MGPDVSTGSLYLVQGDLTSHMNGLRIVLIPVSNFAVFPPSNTFRLFLLLCCFCCFLLLLFAVVVVVVVALI